MRMLLLLVGMAVYTCSVNPIPAQPPPDKAGVNSDSTGTMPAFHLLRQEEDWSVWTGQDDWLSTLKNIDLTRDHSVGLTIGGEVRTYGRWYRNERWGGGPERDSYLLQRFMLHSSVRSGTTDGTNFRVFTQFKSGLVCGRDGPVYPPDRDRLGVNQAFLETETSVRSGTLTMRVGRQELHYGVGRMISVREGPNVRIGFDTVLGRYRYGPWRVDGFVAKPTATPPGVLDNGWIPGRTLWGVYATKSVRKQGYSLYYFGTRRSPSPTTKDLHATRHTVGGRRYGSAGALRYDVEGAIQLGRYRLQETASTAAQAGPVRAWTLAGRIAYSIEGLRTQPTIGVIADWSSGDVEEEESHGTFVAPYPSGRYTGAGSRLGSGNLINAVPYVTLVPIRDVRLQLKTHFFWRSTRSDGVYAIWGAPLRTDPDTRKRLVGVMPEVILSWNAGRHVNLTLEVSEFRTGTVLRQSGSADDMTHVGIRASYTF